jgi:Icc protein
MERRDFIRQMGGLAGGLAFGSLSWPSASWAGGPYENYKNYEKLRLALLADAHLKDGAGHRPEARTLARAVAEINALPQGPDLVLFAGDLAHQGRPDALDLGREILSDLAAPLWPVRGEGDLGRGGSAPWVRRFGSPNFSRAYRGVHILGLDTVLRRTSHGAVFEIGPTQRQWLAQELALLDSATPLVIFSHAPLARFFLPWQQWTQDAGAIAPLLKRVRQVLCLHGHGHGFSNDEAIQVQPAPAPLRHYCLPSTAWPRPQPVQGTPAIPRPGAGPHGCGWTLVNLSASEANFHPYLWQT